jgi:hypothetical protein
MIEYDPNTIHEQVKSYTIIGTNWALLEIPIHRDLARLHRDESCTKNLRKLHHHEYLPSQIKNRSGNASTVYFSSKNPNPSTENSTLKIIFKDNNRKYKNK